MAEIVNLRRARKAKVRAEAAQAAEANRIGFGRSKSEKRETAAVQSLTAMRFDGHKRDLPDAGA